MSVLHVFDMDGTLLRGTTAGLEIARASGCLQELLELEQTFHEGSIDTRHFAKKLVEIWHALTPDIVMRAAENAPWIKGICGVFSDIRQRGEQSLVITMSPDFFASDLTSMGADAVTASRFPPLPFAEELDVAGILTPQDKVTIVKNTLAARAAPSVTCIAYGDSSSDIPLFQHLRNTVSVNGDAQIVPWARLHYRGEDLRQAYALARTCYIDGAAPA